MRRIDDPDLRDHMEVVEGSFWRVYHDTTSVDLVRRRNTIPWALELWQAWRAERKREEPKADATNQIVIYGHGGSNRYFVLYSGEVVFSESHATPKEPRPTFGIHESAVTVAERAGFRIWR